VLSWYLVWTFINGSSGAMLMPDEATCQTMLYHYKKFHGDRVVASCQQGLR
jgi:hypothetical protein